MATIKKNPSTLEKTEQLQESQERTKPVPTPKPKPEPVPEPLTPKLDPNTLVMCQGLFVQTKLKDMSKRFNGKYSKKYLQNKGI